MNNAQLELLDTDCLDGQIHRKMDWLGLVVVSRRQLSTKHDTKPAGSLYYVTDASQQMEVAAEKCWTCGLIQTIRKVQMQDFRVPNCLYNRERLKLNQVRTKEARYSHDIGNNREFIFNLVREQMGGEAYNGN